MKIKRLLTKIGVIIGVAAINIVLVGGNLAWADEPSTVQVEPSREAQCATILSGWCDSAETKGEQTIRDIITFVISVFSIGIGVLATIGLIICGYFILTARDNEQQVSKAKQRLYEIIIGIVIWAIGAGAVLLFIPDEEAANYVNGGGIIINREINR